MEEFQFVGFLLFNNHASRYIHFLLVSKSLVALAVNYLKSIL